MNTHSTVPKHRLYIAVPLFAAVVALSVVSAAMHSTKSAESTAKLLQDDEDQHVMIIGDASFMLMPHAQLDAETLELHGSALIYTHGEVELKVQADSLIAWHGGFHVAEDDTSYTVSALTSPVLIQTESGAHTIVPVGMQLRVVSTLHTLSGSMLDSWYAERRPLPLPAHFFAKQYSLLKDLAGYVTTQVSPTIPSVPIIGDLLRLPAAKQRAEALRQLQDIASVESAVETQDQSLLAELLQQRDVQAALESTNAADALPMILADALDNGQHAMFLQYAASSAERWLLLSFHPSTRQYAGILAIPTDADRDTVVARQIFLPMSDHSDESLDEVVLKNWADTWTALIAEEDGPQLFVASLPILHEQLTRLQDEEFPERVKNYASYATSLVNNVFILLDEAQQSAAESLVQMHDQPSATEEFSTDVTVPDALEEATEQPPVDPEMLLSSVRAMLTANGCMFTAQTVLGHLEGSLIQVENVVIATNSGDQIFSFTVDGTTSELSNIQTPEGKTMPYSMDIQKFLEWAKSL